MPDGWRSERSSVGWQARTNRTRGAKGRRKPALDYRKTQRVRGDGRYGGSWSIHVFTGMLRSNLHNGRFAILNNSGIRFDSGENVS